MKNRFYFLISIFLCCASCSADTEDTPPTIPLSIDHVETHRSGEHLVRVIQHNMELLPQINLELLSTPKVFLADSLTIESIQLDGKKRSFSDSAGVFVEDIIIKESSVMIKLDYYFSDEDSSIVICYIEIKSTFQTPTCSRE